MGQHDRAEAWRLADPAAHRAYYDAWAPTYDADFLAATGYLVPDAVAGVFADARQPGDAPVADLGCGTGALGRAVRTRCPGLMIEGFDISPGMLEKAAENGTYERLHLVDLTREQAQGDFGAVVSSGTFTLGHLGPEGLDIALGLAHAGALIVLGINAHHFERGGFGAALTALSVAGRITSPEFTLVGSYPDVEAGDLENCTRIALFRRTSG